PDQYIAPHLLNPDGPAYDWDTTGNLLLRYHYDFMPKGILTRFIVEMHKFIEGQTLVWKSGVVLTNGSARAEVTELYHKGEIHIRVSGIRPKELMTVITHEINKINRSYDRIQVDKLIPCNCTSCLNTQAPHFYELDSLHERLANHKETIECGKPPYQDVRVRSLIDEVVELKDFRGNEREVSMFQKDGSALKTAPLNKDTWPTQTLQTPTKSAKISPTQRLQLLKTLRGLPRPQFEDLLFALQPPAGNVADATAPQSDRISQLLTWAESGIGCGLITLQETLQMAIGDEL
ncbi:MAG: hypothetical protein O2890_08260, partial [Cyanobacteria bacterium]|nr:hypothetical protein [Cyanobacteriota bacterium]